MTLIITAMAAIVATIAWFVQRPKNKYHFGVLALMFWAAFLMWCVDGIASLLEGESFIEIANTTVMANDALLGGVVVLVGVAVWAIYLLVSNLSKRKSDRTQANPSE